MNQTPAVPDEATRPEGLEFEGRHVHLGVQLLVGRQDQLEPSVQEKPVHLIGSYAATYAIGRLQDVDVHAGAKEDPHAGETGDAGTDHQDIGPGRRVGWVVHGSSETWRVTVAFNPPNQGWVQPSSVCEPARP